MKVTKSVLKFALALAGTPMGMAAITSVGGPTRSMRPSITSATRSAMASGARRWVIMMTVLPSSAWIAIRASCKWARVMGLVAMVCLTPVR